MSRYSVGVGICSCCVSREEKGILYSPTVQSESEIRKHLITPNYKTLISSFPVYVLYVCMCVFPNDYD